MLINDPISDYLSRVRNAIMRRKDSVEMPSSKMLVAISEILKSEGFIDGYEIQTLKPQNKIEVKLRYVNGESAIRGMERVSTPGRRIYRGYKDIKSRFKGGLGISIVSTPAGLVTSEKAQKLKVGGEVICNVY